MSKFFSKIAALLILKTLPIRHKITLAAIIIVLLPMMLSCVYFYYNISSLLTHDAYNNLEQLIGKINENIETSFNIIDNTSLHVLSNSTIRSGIFNMENESDDYSNILKKSEIESELKYSMLFNNAWDTKLITTLYLFFSNSAYCSVSRLSININMVDQNNIKIYKSLDKSYYKGRIILPPAYADQNIYFVRNIFNVNTATIFAKVIIGMDEDILFDKYKEILDYKDSIAFIIDENGIVYSHQDKTMLGKSINGNIPDLLHISKSSKIEFNNQPYYIAAKKIRDSNLTFVLGVPKSQVLLKLSESIRNFLYITLLIVIFSLVFSILLSLRITVFMKDLIYNMNKVKSGNYDTAMKVYSDTELNLLSNTFNKMTGEIKYLISQIYEKQLLVKDTELKFLQAQMNPHFLFNTLITIGYKARLLKGENVFKMVTSLSELLQASIYSKQDIKIPIRKELEFVELYLFLQKERFGDKLQYKINMSDSSIPDLYLPKLCIEPIVENAVVHGLENKEGKGMVTINIYKSGASLYVEVIDDGIGFEADNVNWDETEDLIFHSKGHNNIGLNNTNRRLKLIYGKEYGITIDSKLHQGSKVTIHFPLDTGGTANV